MPDTVSTTACTMLLMPLISPWMKSLPHCRAFPGRLVIKEIAPQKPFWTTDASPERAERMPETRLLKAFTAASFKPVAIFTTVVLIPSQILDAVCFSVFQICEMNWESAEKMFWTPCFSAFAALTTVSLMAFQTCAAVFLILFQILTKNAETCDHRLLHHCGIAEKKSTNFCAAAGMVSVKNTTTLFQSSISFADTVSQSWPNRSVIAPQFFTMAMIAAMAAATPAMMPITGSSEILSAPNATESAAITGVRAVKAT